MTMQEKKWRERRLRIRDTWMPAERKLRADVARQRRRQLWNLLVENVEEPEIWAVGAVALGDAQRIAG